MKIFRTCLVATALVVGTLVGTATAPAGAAPLPNFTCTGGLVPAGVYQSLTTAAGAFCATGTAPGVVEVHGPS